MLNLFVKSLFTDINVKNKKCLELVTTTFSDDQIYVGVFIFLVIHHLINFDALFE